MLWKYLLSFTNSKFILKSVNYKREEKMYSTAKELRFHTKELLESVSRGEEVVITYRGKPYAKLVPFQKAEQNIEKSDELFGMWKDRKDLKDINKYVRELRRGRF
jgi:prevent-host-death family protein